MLRALLLAVEGLASVQLAVVLIAVYIVVLAWATLVEKWFGAPAAQFGIYGAWWFLVLGLLLGLNVLLAVIVRFPWKRYQTGFVVTHVGILVLMFGCVLSYRDGVQSYLSVFEGKSSDRAVCDTRHFELRMAPATNDRPDGEPLARAKPIRVPFRSGPFNWEDYSRRGWFPWSLVQPRPGVVYDRDGVTLEVLDFYSDSRRHEVPRVALTVGPAAATLRRTLGGDAAERIELAVSAGRAAHAMMRPLGMGQRRETAQGHHVAFWMAGSQAETDAFAACRPDGELGPLGQIVLVAGGRAHRFSLESFQKQSRQPLGNTGLDVELIQFDPKMLGVQLNIRKGDDARQPMTLFASLPHFNRHDDRDGVYGAFWVDALAAKEAQPEDATGEKALQDASHPRIDLLQGHDQNLYYRTVRRGRMVDAGRWPASEGGAVGAELRAFAGAAEAVTFTLADFQPRPQPGFAVEPLPFRKDPIQKMDKEKQPRARVKLTVDGQSQEFWLAAPTALMPDDEQHIFEAAGRKVSVVMPQDEVELGFAVHLRKFECRLDPGTSAASYYGSQVDFVEAGGEKRLARDVEITLNAPVDFTDPKTDRTWRLFQSSFSGPFKLGSEVYSQIVGHQSDRKQLYRSILSVNDDPGRGMKYAGSLLIVAGILIIYYMRAYFFARRRGTAESAAKAPEAS